MDESDQIVSGSMFGTLGSVKRRTEALPNVLAQVSVWFLMF